MVRKRNFILAKFSLQLVFFYIVLFLDPRHYCYLIVIAEKCCENRSTPFAVLYSLTYVHSDASPEGALIYEDLQYITPRLEINFEPLIVRFNFSYIWFLNILIYHY